MPLAFNAVELYVVTVNGKPWARAKEVCKALEYQRQTAKAIKTTAAGKTSLISINLLVGQESTHL